MITYPQCFDSEETYQAWKNAARLTNIGINGYCEDCTAVFQARMIRARKCAYPSTTFLTDNEGERGVRSQGSKREIKWSLSVDEPKP